MTGTEVSTAARPPLGPTKVMRPTKSLDNGRMRVNTLRLGVLILGTLCGFAGCQSQETKEVQSAPSPQDASFHFRSAQESLSRRNFISALEELEKVVGIDQNYPKAYELLTETYVRIGRYPQAVKAGGEAVRVNPSDANSYFNLGIALRNEGELDRAIASYREAIRLKPDFGDAYFDLGIAYASKGQLIEAVSATRRAVELNPENASYRHNLIILESQVDKQSQTEQSDSKS